MLSKNKLDNLWQAGFCKNLIEQIRHTAPGAAGSGARVEIMTVHIRTGCVDCHHANTIKDVEHRTALAMGPDAQQLFDHGGDIRQLPGFTEAFRRVFVSGIACGKVDSAMWAWLTRIVSERAGQPYPFAEDDDGSQAN
jgi:hypothetical protein